MKYNSATQSWDASDTDLAKAPNYTNNPLATGDYSGVKQAVNTGNTVSTTAPMTAPTVVSNYNMKSKVNDINSTFQKNASTIIPPFTTNPNYQTTPQSEQQGEQTSYGTSFTPPGGAVIQPNGTYLYEGQYYTKDQLASPENLAAISNASMQKKQYDEALKAELDAINKRYDVYRQQQQDITSSGAAGAQNALLQAGAGGRGSVSQYAAATSDARVASIMADGQKQLAELDAQRSQLLAAARDAFNTKNTKLLDNLNNQIENNRTAMMEVARKSNEAIAKETRISERDNAVTSLYSQGVTDPVEIFNQLKQAGNKTISLADVQETLKIIAPENKDVTKLLLEVAQNPSATPEILKNIKSAKTVADAVLAAGPLVQQPDTEVIKVGSNQAYLIDKKTGKIIKAFGSSGGNSSSGDSGKPPIVDTKTGQMLDYENPAYTITVIRNSRGAKPLTGEQSKPIQKALQAISQVTDLQKNLINQETGPILGTIRSANPYDVKAQIIKGQLTALIPNLARGVYGEVGVLTDADVENYSRTLGNLRSEKEVNDALLAITKKAAFNSIKTNLETMAASGRDVSQFEPIYLNIEKNITPKLPKLSKGQLDDNAFVEAAVSSQSIPYMDLVNNTPDGQIPVVLNSSGEIGYIPVEEFNTSEYTKL